MGTLCLSGRPSMASTAFNCFIAWIKAWERQVATSSKLVRHQSSIQWCINNLFHEVSVLVFILHLKIQCQLNQLDLLSCAVPHYDVQLLVNLWYPVMTYGQYWRGETYRTGIVESLLGVAHHCVEDECGGEGHPGRLQPWGWYNRLVL